MTRTSLDLSPNTINYLLENNYSETDALRLCREESALHPRANYQITPEQGSFLSFLTRMNDSRIAIEIGVFTGYSALITAKALTQNAGPGAKLFALDISHEYLSMAQKYWNMAQLDKYIIPMQGSAMQSLQTLLDKGYEGKIDQIFIDADKAAYIDYYEIGHKLLRKSGIMIFDNMFLSGRAINPAADDKPAIALNELAKFAKQDTRYDISLISVGDGILLAKKK